MKHFSHLYIGSMPVLYANVTATVERPGTPSVPPVDVDLFDNGAGKKKKKKSQM